MKGKVIIAFLIACVALVLAWNVSSVTFRQMLTTVETISAPNEKLTLVNNLSKSINRLDQLQRTMAINSQAYNGVFFKEFGNIRNTLDTLGKLYKDNPAQLQQINLMQKLLLERNQLFLNYLKVKGNIVNNDAMSKQLKSLDGMLLNRSEKADSTTILTLEKKVSTTTILPVDKNESKGFLGRLFGKKKDAGKPGNEKIVSEELQVTVDTIAVADADNTLKEVKEVMLSMKEKQLQQKRKFISNEAELALADNQLTSQMLGILQQVEEDVMRQSAKNNVQARLVVNSGIKYINIILISFLLLTAFLLYFILTDISKSNAYRKQLELAKEEAEYHAAAKQRFLSNMSHEIRTPLQAIIGYTELMKNGMADKYNIDAIYHSSTHLLQIVNEVLDYSRIISDKFSFNLSVFNLSELLQEVVSVMSLSASEKSLELLTNFDLSPSELVEGDAFRLKQILYNLLSNAIKFTDSGKITVTASCKRHNNSAHLMLSVQDTGIGITDQDLKRVFNEFDQGNSPDKNKITSGSGLGLSIVKAITEAQGGRIYVKSDVGEGTTFTLFMQFAVAEAEAPGQSFKQILAQPYKGKIWIVDDDAFILQLCSTILSNNGIDHVCFNDPQHVADMPWDDAVTCILMDMRMPGINGLMLCNMLRKRVPENVKIYALTAQVHAQERDGDVLNVFDGLLIKPFREKELLDLIHVSPVRKKQSFEHAPDLESLHKMTFGDEAQMKKILERFMSDSLQDIDSLEKAVLNYDSDTASLILHRVAGRTAQIGSRYLAAQFRKLETELRENNIRHESAALINESVQNLKHLVSYIQAEIETVTI